MKISSAKNTPLNMNTGTVPNVNSAMTQWFQPMVIGIVTKESNEDTGFQVVETMVEESFKGVIQPFKERDLQLKPEGQRAWSWYWLHCNPETTLEVDDIFKYGGKQYRVMSLKEYKIYGYMEYQLVEDFEGAGPTPVEE